MRSSSSNKRIRSLINELGITQTEFCNKTGIKKSALSNYLNGDRQPRQDQLDKIADTFKINPAWLMGYDVPMSSPRDQYEEHLIQVEMYQREYEKDLAYTAKRIHAYAKLIQAAEKCSEAQVDIATNLLESLQQTNTPQERVKKATEKMQNAKKQIKAAKAKRARIIKRGDAHGKGSQITEWSVANTSHQDNK